MLRKRHVITVLSAAAILCGLVGVAPGMMDRARSNEPLQNCRVVDGDTLRCGKERIRLLGIDAPELPGHCRPGRRCAPGDPFASRSSLEAALGRPLNIRRVGKDRYGRTLALVSGANGDLSCWQLLHGQATYKTKWDDGGRLRRICRAAR
jgi:endonuclease YncB( thermonuclease family)